MTFPPLDRHSRFLDWPLTSGHLETVGQVTDHLVNRHPAPLARAFYGEAPDAL